MVEASLGELCQFIDEYLRLLRREIDDLEKIKRESQKSIGTYQEGFEKGIQSMREIVHLEAELQLAWRQLDEVIASMNWNPSIEEYCRKPLFEIRSLGPGDSIEEALRIVRRRESLQKELLKYLLKMRPDLLEDRFPEYIERSFKERWECSLRRMRSA